MTTASTDTQWLVEGNEISFVSLAESSNLSPAELQELVDFGVIAPVDPGVGERTFHADCILTVRSARRLREDLELDPHALALTLALVNRVRELETQLRALRAQLPRRLP
jgi:chaperone modulatory protein CbpM